MNKINSDQWLTTQVDNLPKELNPKRDLWLGIERAIHNKPQLDDSITKLNKTFPIAWAASVIAAVLLTWNVLAPQSVESPSVLVMQMQDNFERQKQAMLVSYGQPKLADLPESLQQQLAELVSARQSINNALKEDPANSDLLNILRWTQEQELELLIKLYSPQWQKT